MEKEFELTAELEDLGVDNKLITDLQKQVKEQREKDDKLGIVFPIVVKGTEYDAKELYCGLFRQPNFKTFSKYLVASAQNQAGAMRQLARDCFLVGDKELVEDDSLFLFGLMGQLSKIIEMRNGALVNLSKTGK